MWNPSDWLRSLYKDVLKEVYAENKPKGDVVAAARQIINSVYWDVLEIDEMPQKEREELLMSAHEIMKQPALAYVVSGLVKEQVKKTVRDGTEEKHYLAGRSIIMGISLVRETLSMMDERFKALGAEDDYDKESLI